MTEFTARNGVQRYVFDGRELGYATTDNDSSRWTEITIYRTEAGKYVFEKIGRSVVYHTTDKSKWVVDRCMDKNYVPYGKRRNQDWLNEDSRPCPFCKPDPDAATEFMFETDRFFAVVTETASALVEACRVTDNDPSSDGFGTMFIPKVASRALTEAGEQDEGIRDAYLTQWIA